MNLKIPLRVGRILVVLALIVALLGSSIPVPARAVGFVPGLYYIAANIGVNAALRAIGVGPGNSPDAFNQLVTDATNNLFEGLSPLTQVFLDYTQNGFRAFLSADFLSRLLTFMIDSGSLVSSPSYSTNISAGTPVYLSWRNNPSAAGFYTASLPCFAINVRWGSYNYICLFFEKSPTFYNSSGSSVGIGTSTSVYLSNLGLRYMYSFDSTLPSDNSFITQIYDRGAFDGTFNNFIQAIFRGEIPGYTDSISSPDDLSLDQVSGTLAGSAYTDWTADSITQEDQPFVPVSIPSISDSAAIFTQTQAQAQAGTIPETVVDEIVAGAEVDPDVVTLTDIFTAIRSLGADVVEAIQAVPAAIAAIFEPPVVYDSEGNVLPAYQISLTDFFPFCLPFDIYDLLSALAADPVAPVFEWTIAVPRWGISHDIEIDLSEWDSIARLFRTFELAAFVLGLALITREKFLRS